MYLRALESTRCCSRSSRCTAQSSGPPCHGAPRCLSGSSGNPNHGHGRQVVVAVSDKARNTRAWPAGSRSVANSLARRCLHATTARPRCSWIEPLIARARAAGAAWIRIGCADSEDHKRAVLVARGFSVQLHFVTMSCAAEPRDAAPPHRTRARPAARDGRAGSAARNAADDASMLEIEQRADVTR